MKFSIVRGASSIIVHLFILDSASATGAGKTGLVFNSAGIKAYYIRPGDAAATSISLVTATVGTWTSGGFKEVDATNLPGIYEFHLPNALVNATGIKRYVTIMFSGATGMAPLPLEIELTGWDNQAGSLSTAGDADIADKILGRSLAIGADGGRTVQDALRAIRNRTNLAGSTLTVYAEDDATTAWTAAVTTTAGNPISQIDPA